MRIPLVTEIQRFCLQDGPGIRTTIYLKGCPLHCPWCHNPEAISEKQEIYFHATRCLECGQCAERCPTGSIALVRTPDQKTFLTTDLSKCTACLKCIECCLGRAREVVGKSVNLEDIVQEALTDEMFFRNSGGGITISGGEPLYYPEFLLELTRNLKAKSSVHIAIETSCIADWNRIEPLLETIDLFIVDIKTMSPDKYHKVIGGSLSLVLSNLENILKHKNEVRVHLPIIPGFNDSSADFSAYVQYLGRFTEKLSGIDILPFHSYAAGKYAQLCREYQYKGVEDLSNEHVMPLMMALKQNEIGQVTIGGISGCRKTLNLPVGK